MSSTTTATDKKVLKSVIDHKLVKSGEKEKLKEFLRHRLISIYSNIN